MNLLGKPAPSISATAVVEGQVVRDFSLEAYRDQYVVLFFYPEDFTSVCGSEVHAFQERLGDFTKRDAVVIGCSTDTPERHVEFLSTLPSEDGAQGVTYPLIADPDRNVSSLFGTLDGPVSAEPAPVCQRGLFIIDKGGTVWFQSYHFKPIGRDLDSVLRELDAIRRLQIDGQLCMAGWKG